MPPCTLIAALDIGTTTVRCQLIDNNGIVKYSTSQQVKLLYPKPGYVEINPDQLWESILDVLRKTINDSGFDQHNIRCLGISSQRCSFITWNRKTNKPYHNFITWKDIRADNLVSDMNDSYTLKMLQFGAKCLHTVTRSKRFLAGSVLKFMNVQVTVRLLWVLKNVPNVLEDAKKQLVSFGTVDTWLLHKLSGGVLHLTDVSSASATGLFDPFTMTWADWAIKLYHIPKSILPEVVDTTGDHFGNVCDDILGFSLPIRCLVADQSAALFGSCCFKLGELKITMGTGTFLNVNTGNSPHASVAGLYPVVGWRQNGETTYLAEGSSNDTGSLIQWALDLGLMKNPMESAKLASSVSNSDGVFFIPAFSGLQAPVNDPQAGTGFIGIKPTSRKEHLLRAILEAIVFRVTQLFNVFTDESPYIASNIKIDGGVSRNDFISQLLADMTGLPVIRSETTEMSALGAAYLAGYAIGVWKSLEEIQHLNNSFSKFLPSHENGEAYSKTFSLWCDALNRFRGWYNIDDDSDD